jgi:hypothetical protein
MKSSLKKIRLSMPIVAAIVLLSSCLFPEVIEVDIFVGEEGGFFVSVSTDADVSLCTQESDDAFTCLYAGEAGAAITSNVILTGADILLLLIFDPLIIQLPDTATNLAGSFLHDDSGTSGNLVITSGLTSFNADLDTTITAEPGTQFVILDLPDAAPMTGSFAFNVNFALPPGTASLQLKPLFTGKVVANGQTFFPPLLPCVTDFANVPALNVPFPTGGAIPIPLGQVQGCDNVVYNFGPNGPPPGDSDDDGVLDGDDVCPETTIPESVPTHRLEINRFALVDDDTSFDTTAPQGRGPRKAFTLEDTAGCSCEQIIAQLGLGVGHTKFGCSISAMEEWRESRT